MPVYSQHTRSSCAGHRQRRENAEAILGSPFSRFRICARIYRSSTDRTQTLRANSTIQNIHTSVVQTRVCVPKLSKTMENVFQVSNDKNKIQDLNGSPERSIVASGPTQQPQALPSTQDVHTHARFISFERQKTRKDGVSRHYDVLSLTTSSMAHPSMVKSPR